MYGQIYAPFPEPIPAHISLEIMHIERTQCVSLSLLLCVLSIEVFQITGKQIQFKVHNGILIAGTFHDFFIYSTIKEVCFS